MVTIIKTALVLILLYILVNLALAGVAMVRDKQSMTQYLGRRVGFSALVLVIIILSMAMGWLPMNPRPY
ncbi:DUF2909 domain-containing protein [Ferrimonas lipolytica]|uniref:DUF2909 domain-containing protein n=1 Tax=Ferrimonas lipolytica TaxID=2724191 RepID=A0A6H1UIF7_9GAMM|nr:DUF2909 domain-containing protein [Ferrimonas lipolytica]QIZ78390.1 DUF2909 domain-containing protein [Ferrimonas lipolytica]